MDVEFNLLQQRFNKIELEKTKEKKLHSQKQEERQKHEENKHKKNSMKLIKKFKVLLIGKSVIKSI